MHIQKNQNTKFFSYTQSYQQYQQQNETLVARKNNIVQFFELYDNSKLLLPQVWFCCIMEIQEKSEDFA